MTLNDDGSAPRRGPGTFGRKPVDPPDLAEAAVHFHELFLSFMKAGFTEAQALTLVGSALSVG